MLFFLLHHHFFPEVLHDTSLFFHKVYFLPYLNQVLLNLLSNSLYPLLLLFLSPCILFSLLLLQKVLMILLLLHLNQIFLLHSLFLSFPLLLQIFLQLDEQLFPLSSYSLLILRLFYYLPFFLPAFTLIIKLFPILLFHSSYSSSAI